MSKKIILAVMLVAFGLVGGILVKPLISADNIYDQLKKYTEVFNTVVKNYVDPVDSATLTESAIRGMLNELDPHSVYITAEDMRAVNEDMQGSFDGIGVQFDMLNDTITIISPISGGPSEAVGIIAGDKIVKIDGVDAVGIKRDDVPKKLRGVKGTIVKLDIFRPGNEDVLHFTIVRDKIPLYSVDGAYILPNTDIGVIAVNRFSSTTHDEMVEAAKKLKAQGMKKLILDLRFNPGGYLNQAFEVADEFLPGSGDTIVYTKSRLTEFDEVYRANKGQQLEDIPLIVMINPGSASASEIVSGAIQDLDRGLVVGTTSFGKGLVQRQYPVFDGSAFRLTISRYYTPSGRSIQRPYKDKAGYRNLMGRLELEEGANIDHAIEKIKKQISKENEDKKDDDKIILDSIPLYKTRSGRTVLGGGGITPDYIVKSDTITKLSFQIRSKGVLNEFVNSYLNSGKALRDKYGDNFNGFYKDYHLSDTELKEFRKLSESKGIVWNDDDYKTDKEYLELMVKSILANMIWDRSKQMLVISKADNQLQKAATLFPEADKIFAKSKKK